LEIGELRAAAGDNAETWAPIVYKPGEPGWYEHVGVSGTRVEARTVRNSAVAQQQTLRRQSICKKQRFR